MEVAILWVIVSVLVGVAAGSRGRSSGGWCLLSLVISPLIAGILLALMPALNTDSDKPTPDTHVKCPDCAELVRKEARVCKHCGCRLVPQT